MRYANPRMSAVVPDWPSGAGRVAARFEIERDPKRGERATRRTTGAVKALAYASLSRIVDGDDGRIYIARLTESGHISIMRGDMRFQHETVFPGDPRWKELRELFAADAEGAAGGDPE